MAICLGLVALAVVGYVAWLLTPPAVTPMSAEWLARRAEQERMAGAPWHGAAIRWPMKKMINEHPLYQTRRLRRAK